jgi:hypothetical protein
MNADLRQYLVGTIEEMNAATAKFVTCFLDQQDGTNDDKVIEARDHIRRGFHALKQALPTPTETL